uniref:Mitochondrial import inner membrane translocase subunit TIM50 n=1 Tax=Strongyloides papillosus TaxID=174720 RepID=A0A0N5CDI1_STREA
MRHHLFSVLTKRSNLISNLSIVYKNRFLSSSGIILNKKIDKGFETCLDEPKVVSPFIYKHNKIPNEDFSSASLKLHDHKEIAKEKVINGNIEKEKIINESIEKEKIIDNVKKMQITSENIDKKKIITTNNESTVNPKETSESAKEVMDEKEKSEKRQKRDKNTILSMKILFGTSVVGLISFFIYSAKEQRDEQGNVIIDQYSGQILAPLWRILDSVKNVKKIVCEPCREKLLPDPLQYPYLQPKYTLVIEMKNVLLHPEWTYKTGYRFKKRPALDYFLDVVGYPNFEVVIYTSESNMSAPPILDQLDPNQKIMYKLYRDCTLYENGHYRKDLSKLNRDLSKVIYIDYDPESFKLNPENVLRVPKWEGDMEDTSLIDLAELLKTILQSDVDDVRPTLQYYSQYDDPAKEFKRRALYLAQKNEENQPKEKESKYAAIKRYSGSLFGFKRHS